MPLSFHETARLPANTIIIIIMTVVLTRSNYLSISLSLSTQIFYAINIYAKRT